MKGFWKRRKSPTEAVIPIIEPVIPRTPDRELDGRPLYVVHDLDLAQDEFPMQKIIDDALFKHSAEERARVDEMWLVMLTQTEEPKMGLLVETSYVDTGGDDIYSMTIESTVSLSSEVPFGEIRYRNK